MSEWITDRPPTEADAGPGGIVWTTYNGKTVPWSYDGVAKGTPWMPVNAPEPYVKPKWKAVYEELCGCWVLYLRHGHLHYSEELKHLHLSNNAHRKAAKRIAAIYDELMP
jgi:hypothetical protein